MKEFIEKLIGRLEEKVVNRTFDESIKTKNLAYKEAIEIVNQLAEEYNNEAVKGDLISKKAVITELNGIYLDNPWDDKEDILEKAIGIVDHFPTAYNNGWIPCSERLPDKEGEYLVTLRRWNCVTFANFKDIKNNPHFDTNYVTAWQPLPAPYQPKGE